MPAHAPRPAAVVLFAGLFLFAGHGPACAGAADSSAASALPASLAGAGLENVTVESGDTLKVAYENRRFRHSADALGVAEARTGTGALVFERRLGLVAGAIRVSTGADSAPRFHVRYPSDLDFPRPPRGRFVSPTFARADLDVGPVVDYRIGQLFDPLEVRADLEPRLLWNPWPGALFRAGVRIPLANDYPAGPLDEDAGRFRPGNISLEQFAWIPRVALASVSAGYFGDNRYGVSVGAARPIAGGALLLDAQYDRTGYLAFPGETVYSDLQANSGYAGVAWRPAFVDVTVRARLAQFLYGDRGAELELTRRFDDLEIGYFTQRTEGIETYGIRFDFPIPPRLRASGSRLRVQPVERFALSFRDEGASLGSWLTGVADREDWLRQLDDPELQSRAGRFRTGLEGDDRVTPRHRSAPEEWVAFSGMTGFIQTPWAGVISDRGLEAGYDWVPKKWAYDHRGRNDNQIFYATLGFLPRVETAIRWTRIPGYHSFEEIVPDSKLVDIDRMSSGRVEIVPATRIHPGLAAGIEDVQGTRRFHSTYTVAGMPFSIFQLEGRASLGYGFRAFDAGRYVLDGTFGALELDPTRFARVQAEYDTEKWNIGLGLSPGAGFRIRAALLNLESLTIGAGWAHSL